MRTLRTTAQILASAAMLGAWCTASGKDGNQAAGPFVRTVEPKVPANYENVLRAVAQADNRRPAPRATAGRSADAGRKSPSWYLGANLGRSAFDAGFEHTNSTIASTGASTFFVTPQAYDGMWKAYLGYWLTPRISLEAGYYRFGGPSYTANVTAPASTTFLRDFSVHGYGLDAVFWQPVTDSFIAFGRIGGMYTVARASSAVPGAGLASLPAEVARTGNLHAGVGVKYRIFEALDARFEYDYVRKAGDAAKFGTADVHGWSLGLGYNF